MLSFVLGIVLGVSQLQPPLCTWGNNDTFGWYEENGQLVIREFSTPPTSCVPSTEANLAIVPLGTQTVPLIEGVRYQFNATPSIIESAFVEPILCHSNYNPTPGDAIRLLVKDPNDDVALDVLINSMVYEPNTGKIRPQTASSNPIAQCYSGLQQKFTSSGGTGEKIFNDSFEHAHVTSNLKITITDANGVTFPDDIVLQQYTGISVMRVNVENVGTSVMHDVRVKEFVPTQPSLLTPTVVRVDCIDDQTGYRCTGGSGVVALNHELGDLYVGQTRTLTVTRKTLAGLSADDDAILQVAAFSNDEEDETGDNSYTVRLRVSSYRWHK